MKERKKGNSLIAFPESYTVVDLETTGYSGEFNSIIEIGSIKYRNGLEVSRYEMLLKPVEKIPYIVECITGIRNEMVVDAPTFGEKAQEIWEYLSGEIIIGHNVNFDINFLYDKFEGTLGVELQNDFIDTMRLAKKILPEMKAEGYGLDNLREHFGINLDAERHRAIGDCLYTNELFCRLKKYAAEKDMNLSAAAKVTSGKYPRVNLKEIKGNEKTYDASHIFFNKNCVFTGKLEEFERKAAAQIVANIGGRIENSVTKNTNFLIVGDMDYRKGLNGYESSKLRKAKQLIEQGQKLQIIPESAFYDLVAEYLSENSSN